MKGKPKENLLHSLAPFRHLIDDAVDSLQAEALSEKYVCHYFRHSEQLGTGNSDALFAATNESLGSQTPGMAQRMDEDGHAFWFC